MRALAVAAQGDAPDRWWSPGEGPTFPASLDYANERATGEPEADSLPGQSQRRAELRAVF